MLYFYIVYLNLCVIVYGSLQSAGARGQLLCDGKPASGVRVELYDEDRMIGDSDELLGQNISSSDGSFHVSGSTSELSSIDPKLIIYPNCVGGSDPISIYIPDEFITEGSQADKIYDAGALEMSQSVTDASESSESSSHSGSSRSHSRSKKRHGSGIGKVVKKVREKISQHRSKSRHG
uniref:Uncharacterized protein n=1 Tax=Acrobeloides nanus TaxID=290746 RepID=A0A914EIW5_9BILA